MKKGMLVLIALCFVFFACGKKDDVKKTDEKVNELKEVQYGGTISVSDNELMKYFVLKSDANITVLSLQIKYAKNDESKANEFANISDKVGKYPVVVSKFEKAAIVSVMLPNKVYITLSSTDKSTDKFQTAEFLKKVIPMFDTDGLEKISGDMIKGAELEKYFPKL
jgi:major membrane immunogen (membrane-anchored lipoprotein)